MRSSTESNEKTSQTWGSYIFLHVVCCVVGGFPVFPIIFRPFPGWVVSEKWRPFWRLGQKGDLPRFSGGLEFHTGWQPGTTRKMLGRSQEKIKTFINIKHEEPIRILKFHYNSYQTQQSKQEASTINLVLLWDTVSFFLLLKDSQKKTTAGHPAAHEWRFLGSSPSASWAEACRSSAVESSRWKAAVSDDLFNGENIVSCFRHW